MTRGDAEFFTAIHDALETLVAETGRDAEALFGERVFEPEQLSAKAAHAMGIIEGSAAALGVTALVLVDELKVGLGQA